MAAEPRRSSLPVLDPEHGVDVSHGFAFVRNGKHAPPDEVERVIETIGRTPAGTPWDCGACGYGTCAAFAGALLKGRATYRQCPPHQERRLAEAEREAAVDALTGLATFRVLRERLAQEVARSGRSVCVLTRPTSVTLIWRHQGTLKGGGRPDCHAWRRTTERGQASTGRG